MLRISGELSRSSGPELGVGEGESSGTGVVAVLDAAAVGMFCHSTRFAASAARYSFIFFCCEGRAAPSECSRRVAVGLGFLDGRLGNV
jgi:hypothetical protein